MTPLSEQLAQAIEATLWTAAGVTNVSRIAPSSADDLDIDDGLVILSAREASPLGESIAQSDGIQTWRQRFSVMTLIQPSDRDTRPFDQIAGELAESVRGAIERDLTFGGLAIDTEIESMSQVKIGEAIVPGKLITFSVVFRTISGSPALQA